MNSIYKCLNGQHIDLSKIVSVQKAICNASEGVYVHFQLMDGPVFLDTYPTLFEKDTTKPFEQMQEELYQDTLMAWKKYKREIDPETEESHY